MVQGWNKGVQVSEWAVSCSPFLEAGPAIQYQSIPKMKTMILYFTRIYDLPFKIPKKAPSAALPPALDKPVIQRRREFFNNTLDAGVVRKND